MTNLQYDLIVYVALTYLISAIWFLFMERKDGFLMWRLVTFFFAPIMLPFVSCVYAIVKLFDWLIGSKQAKINKTLK